MKLRRLKAEEAQEEDGNINTKMCCLTLHIFFIRYCSENK